MLSSLQVTESGENSAWLERLEACEVQKTSSFTIRMQIFLVFRQGQRGKCRLAFIELGLSRKTVEDLIKDLCGVS